MTDCIATQEPASQVGRIGHEFFNLGPLNLRISHGLLEIGHQLFFARRRKLAQFHAIDINPAVFFAIERRPPDEPAGEGDLIATFPHIGPSNAKLCKADRLAAKIGLFE